MPFMQTMSLMQTMPFMPSMQRHLWIQCRLCNTHNANCATMPHVCPFPSTNYFSRSRPTMAVYGLHKWHCTHIWHCLSNQMTLNAQLALCVLHKRHCMHIWHCIDGKNGIVGINGIVCINGIVLIA